VTVKNKKNKSYDVIVIGGGHSGCEAALSSARNGVRALLISINMDSIALMPFGGKIGGPLKAKLVDEIKALDGEIIRNTKKNWLNIKKVKDRERSSLIATQAVVDRRRYFLTMKEVLEKQEYLDLRQGLAVVIREGKKGLRLVTSDETIYECRSLIICAGTFLRGNIIWGKNLIEAGRQGEINSKRLAESLDDLNFKFIRKRKYIAPMVDRKTINLSKLKKEPMGHMKAMFSGNKNLINRKQLKNYIAYTGREWAKDFLKMIKDEMGYCRSEVYEGIGNEVSVERRIFQSDGKEWLSIFIQPVGRDTNEMYLQGLETMLPEEVQQKMIGKIKGFEEAEMTRPGYAVEYDCLAAGQIDINLESRNLKDVFFAGHINGTSGYEEAAAQGIVAGINAAGKPENLAGIINDNNDGYIKGLLRDISEGLPIKGKQRV
jgi:tRNA uridine 5-carboxymethylaminomethyl modification enzyme